MDAQYIRVNVNPSDHYVPLLPGTLGKRIRPDDAPWGRLVLAGDWTRNGVNVGAAESAVMSGMLASRAISSFPEKIYWEKDKL